MKTMSAIIGIAAFVLAMILLFAGNLFSAALFAASAICAIAACKTSLGWKVPFRQSYCEAFRDWVAQTIYCHAVLKIGTRRKHPPLGIMALFFVLFALALSPAKADPQNYQSVAVTNLSSVLTNTFFPTTNINATFTIPQNAALVFQPTFAIQGTSTVSTATYTPMTVVSPTNFTGLAKGRLDAVLMTNGIVTLEYNFTVGDGNWTTTFPYTNAYSIGATNLALSALSIGQKQVSTAGN